MKYFARTLHQACTFYFWRVPGRTDLGVVGVLMDWSVRSMNLLLLGKTIALTPRALLTPGHTSGSYKLPRCHRIELLSIIWTIQLRRESKISRRSVFRGFVYEQIIRSVKRALFREVACHHDKNCSVKKQIQ